MQNNRANLELMIVIAFIMALIAISLAATIGD